MISEKKTKHSFASFFICSARSLLRAVLLLLLCSNPLAARQNNAPETVTIKLPHDGPVMRFKAVYLGIKKDKKNGFPTLFASRKFKLGSREQSEDGYKRQQVTLNLAGSFIGKKNEQLDWLYYLGETEVSRGQWNRVMRWMDKQEGRTSAAKALDDSQAQLPQNKITVAQVYRFIEALNTWMLQQQKDKLPRIGQAYAFARLPTEAEWAFAARGGINVLENDPDRFDRSHPYTQELGKYEWYSTNSGTKPKKCGKNEFANPIGLRDMLGNVEELTLSLFGPFYIDGRLGQLVIRGNSFRDKLKEFDVSCRTEFASHSSDGKLILNDRVGFRLALSSSISASGDSKALNKEGKDYKVSLKPTGSLTDKAEENCKEQFKADINRFKADIKDKNDEISRLQRLRNKDQAVFAEKEEKNVELRNRKEELEAQVHDLEKQLIAGPAPEAIEALQQQLRQAKAKIQGLTDDLQDEKERSKRLAAIAQDTGSVPSFQAGYEKTTSKLRQQVKDLRQQLAAMLPFKEGEKYKKQLAQLQKQNESLTLKLSKKQRKERFFIDEGSLRSQQLEKKQEKIAELERNLEQKQQRIADLERRQFNRENIIAENAKLAKMSEKRYLEALMRQAYSNAYNAYVQLVKRQEIYLPQGVASQRKAEKAYSQACQYLHDYWSLVKKIAQETQAGLFPQVKQEVSDWLQEGEEKNIFSKKCRTEGDQQFLSPIQRKSLDLIERHVQRVRAGGSRFPDDLIDSFIDQPEFR